MHSEAKQTEADFGAEWVLLQGQARELQSKEVKEVGFEPKSAGLQSPTLLHKGPNNTPVW